MNINWILAGLATLDLLLTSSTGRGDTNSSILENIVENIPIEVTGADEQSFTPKSEAAAVRLQNKFDTIIVGGGLGGLSAAFFLTQPKLNKKILLIEKEPRLGGLASSNVVSGVTYDRGAAYWTDAYQEEQEITNAIGLGKFDKYEIPAPIDSYLWKEKLYPGIWEEKATMDALPQSFPLLQFELTILSKVSEDIGVPNQPIEEQGSTSALDRLSTAEWLKSLPARVAIRAAGQTKDLTPEQISEAKKLLNAFRSDPKVNLNDGANGMKDLVEFIDLYCRSALGTTTNGVSAAAFVNFYSSEIIPRYTTAQGTGYAATKMHQYLVKVKNFATLLTSSTVVRIETSSNGTCPVEVEYLNKNGRFIACANYAVYASQVKFAPRIIKNLEKTDPEKIAIISKLRYSHYSVHTLFVEGHPFREAYDTWVRPTHYRPDHFTDMILGRWMDPAIAGYQTSRASQIVDGKILYDQKEVRVNGVEDAAGVLSIYHPLPQNYIGNGNGYSLEVAKKLAREATVDMIDQFGRLVVEPIKVKKIITNSWPYSVHIPHPGFFTYDAPILRKATNGRIVYAHSNLGTPAFEEALFRGHCAAQNILLVSQKGYKMPKWSRCPKENLIIAK